MLRDKHVASFTPTSGFAIRKLCRKIDFNKRNVIVEYGPGTGVFTRYFLAHLTPDSILILIERNKDFVHIIKESIQDPRLIIFHESAENIEQILLHCNEQQADYIVSGIPFSFLQKSLRELIIRNSYKCLKEGGSFLGYQTFFQIDRFLKDHLDCEFNKVQTEICVLNVPPLKIFEAIK
ncbi:class I SAM-dependent methyltransferase [Hymenobacter radiodurans]|uniref:class I SAM-dependent methyltransferase n=1 Tax=Hymenobacter radiodurans TaxID=2496028 RepID=UPI001058FC5D|nr:methyltransferase domain-containing protein [Hymenobacter radiodurans]